MNFLAATVEDGKLRTGLGDLPLSDQLRRAIESSGAGRDVIVGIRPEDFEDVSLVSPENRRHGVTLRASIDVFESLGADVFVYFTLDRQQAAKAAELEELAKDSGRADTGSSVDTVTARLDPAARVREGEEAELWVDLRPMHVFNPATGENLALGDGVGKHASSGSADSAATSSAAGTSSAASTSSGGGSTEVESGSTGAPAT
jgi:multiple sugar transport system ATP-binding protein